LQSPLVHSSVLVLVLVLVLVVNRPSLLLFLASQQPNLLGLSQHNRLQRSTNSRLSPNQPSGLTPPNQLV